MTAIKTTAGHIDHITYAVAPANAAKQATRWGLLGFHEHVRLRTRKFPATHVALVSGHGQLSPWAIMTGMSVSEDPASPINEFIRRYGEGVQHTAYNIDPLVDMEALHAQMQGQGVDFMTRVLTHTDGGGARLRQMFIAPTRPYGSFLEFIQRLPGPDGNVFDGFDVENIEDLYACYADYSAWLDREQRIVA
jgi:hypothetical protein